MHILKKSELSKIHIIIKLIKDGYLIEKRRLGTRPNITCENDAINILKSGNDAELSGLAMSIGFDCLDLGFAQSICLRLLECNNSGVRANAIIGLAHIARRFGTLDKRVVKPYVLRELRENSEHKELIFDAVRQINMYLNWNLGSKITQ